MTRSTTPRSALLAGAVLLLAPFLGACAAREGGPDTIGVSVADQKSQFYVAEVDGIRDEARRLGVKVKVSAANNDANTQIKQVQTLLIQQVGALIFTPQDSTSAGAGVKAANTDGVPVIAVDQRPSDDQGRLATYIATDSVKAAAKVCTWMFDQIGGKGQIAVLHGVLGSTAEIQRTEGCKKALAKYPDIDVVAQDNADWDETEAFKATQDMLTAHPDIRAVFGESDAMALGAAKAARGADKKIVSVGIDGFPTMFDGVASGLTQATEAQKPYTMGRIAVRNAVALMRDKKARIPALQYQDTVLITKDSIRSNRPETFYGPNAEALK